MYCSQCGVPLPPEARFCPTCGKSLGAIPPANALPSPPVAAPMALGPEEAGRVDPTEPGQPLSSKASSTMPPPSLASLGSMNRSPTRAESPLGLLRGPASLEPEPRSVVPRSSFLPAPADLLCGFFVSFASDSRGEFWALRGGAVVLGRSDSGERLDIPLRDPTVSARHALLTMNTATGEVFLEDLDSSNGTYINGRRLSPGERLSLEDRDHIALGGFLGSILLVLR